MAGPVERAIRASIEPGGRLHTLPRRAPFMVQAVDERGVVLLLGKKRAWTRLSWDCLEGVLLFLRGRGWVRIGGVFSTDSDPGTLDGYMKQYTKRATASWVAGLLAEAGVIEVDLERPAKVRLRPDSVRVGDMRRAFVRSQFQNYIALAALAAATLIALTAGAWYARRRWLG